MAGRMLASGRAKPGAEVRLPEGHTMVLWQEGGRQGSLQVHRSR